jgi:hypothetical protein
MALIVSTLSTLILGIGVFGLVSPAGMQSLVSGFRSPAGRWTAVALRLVLGIALWRVAPASRTPAVLHVLAVLFGASALVLVLMGERRFEALLSSWLRKSPSVVRASSLVPVLLGAFLLWSTR